MSASWGTADTVALVAADYDFADSTAEVFFEPGKTSWVKRVVAVVNETTAGTSTVTVVIEDAGTGTNSTTLGTIVIPAGLAANTTFKVELAKPDPDGEDGDVPSQVADVTLGRVNTIFDNQPGVHKVAFGQRMGFTSDGLGTAGIANWYVEYFEDGNQPEVIDAEVDFTHA